MLIGEVSVEGLVVGLKINDVAAEPSATGLGMCASEPSAKQPAPNLALTPPESQSS